MEIILINILNKVHGQLIGKLSYTLSRLAEVNISSKEIGNLTETGTTLFDALLKLRLELEKHGWFLLCNVARRDAYPSQMMMQMAMGRKIYVTKHGLQARRQDIVDIFGEATPDQIGTVEEQRRYHEDWIKSLGIS
ncbi:hypothetical protein [Noviherbaspirillum malthae]|uniref:hypothetical protein n=1 Tax=Noviherbaspirillum malthae TaxID=1260987 RepID=UPI00188DF2FA|nr:hypothetical protein [Noviherbaspirillum malthae]